MCIRDRLKPSLLPIYKMPFTSSITPNRFEGILFSGFEASCLKLSNSISPEGVFIILFNPLKDATQMSPLLSSFISFIDISLIDLGLRGSGLNTI